MEQAFSKALAGHCIFLGSRKVLQSLFHGIFNREPVVLPKDGNFSMLNEPIRPADPLDGSLDSRIVEMFDDGRSKAIV